MTVFLLALLPMGICIGEYVQSAMPYATLIHHPAGKSHAIRSRDIARDIHIARALPRVTREISPPGIKCRLILPPLEIACIYCVCEECGYYCVGASQIM